MCCFAASISTSAAANDVVIEVQADDLDLDSDLAYSLSPADGGECDTGYFTIFPSTGRIIVRKDLTPLIVSDTITFIHKDGTVQLSMEHQVSASLFCTNYYYSATKWINNIDFQK